jgi:septal ring factor EnvC (AmiA/AmiB activator)
MPPARLGNWQRIAPIYKYFPGHFFHGLQMPRWAVTFARMELEARVTALEEEVPALRAETERKYHDYCVETRGWAEYGVKAYNKADSVAETVGLVLRDVHGLRVVQVEHGKQLAEVRTVQADHTRQLGEVRTVQADHTRQLGEVRTVQADHTRQLGEVRTVLDDHTRQLGEVRTVLDDHTRQLADHGKQLSELRVDLAETKEDVRVIKVDLAGVKVDLAGVKEDVREIKTRLNEQGETLQEILAKVS